MQIAEGRGMLTIATSVLWPLNSEFRLLRILDRCYSWTTEGSNFETRYCQEFSLLHIVQTGFGPTQHPIQWILGIKQSVR
jgi:hypothetical protein